jgi:hypothetical protein
MPTTIDSAGIIFNDATSLTSANIGTAQLVNGSVTAAKLGTTEQKQIAKAWVNFNGAQTVAPYAAPSGNTLIVTSGSNIGTWVSGTWTSAYLGVIYYFNIGGTNQTLGGVNVSTVGIQITNIISSTQANFILLAGNATSSQTVNGNGTNSGFLLSSSGIRSSYNVSSITKNGTGDYTVNFTTPMADANYACLATSTYGTSNSSITNQTSSLTRIGTYTTTTGVNQDQTQVSVAIFGN